MKQVSLALSLIMLILSSCKNKKPAKLLSANNLKSYFVTINSDSAYNLKTPNGALITIFPKSFKVPDNSAIKIEIKEAYSLYDIVLGGLLTESDDQPLRSSGMLYFSATANNKEIDFIKPVKAAIPSKSFDKTMQVYKGEVQDDSTINWVNPAPVDTSLTMKHLLLGEELFKANCANCHKPIGEFTGPGLAGTRQRSPSPEWVYRFIKNPAALVASDSYARELFNKYRPTIMTSFPNLKNSEIKSILDFCDNAQKLSLTNSPELISSSKNTSIPSCGYDTFYYPKPKNNIEVVSSIQISTENYSDFESNSFNDSITLNTISTDPKEQEFVRKGYNNVMPAEGVYQFNIDESGWYNIDVLFDEPNATKVKLFAKIQMPENVDMDVYLCLPKRKVLQNANKHNNDIYLFHYSDANGYLPMILNDDAIIFAVASVEDKIFYGITKFKVREQQTISVEIKESTRSEVLAAFQNNQLDSIKLDIEKKEMEIIEKPCEGYPTADSSKIIASNNDPQQRLHTTKIFAQLRADTGILSNALLPIYSLGLTE